MKKSEIRKYLEMAVPEYKSLKKNISEPDRGGLLMRLNKLVSFLDRCGVAELKADEILGYICGWFGDAAAPEDEIEVFKGKVENEDVKKENTVCEMRTLNLSFDEFQEFIKEKETAEKQNQETFKFKGHAFDTKFAGYLIEHVKMKLEKEKPTNS